MRMVESCRERARIADEIGMRAWGLMVEENSESWNTARLCAVLRRRVR